MKEPVLIVVRDKSLKQMIGKVSNLRRIKRGQKVGYIQSFEF